MGKMNRGFTVFQVGVPNDTSIWSVWYDYHKASVCLKVIIWVYGSAKCLYNILKPTKPAHHYFNSGEKENMYELIKIQMPSRWEYRARPRFWAVWLTQLTLVHDASFCPSLDLATEILKDGWFSIHIASHLVPASVFFFT